MVKRGNGSESISAYKTSKGKTRYRIRITTVVEFDEVTGRTKIIAMFGIFSQKVKNNGTAIIVRVIFR